MSLLSTKSNGTLSVNEQFKLRLKNNDLIILSDFISLLKECAPEFSLDDITDLFVTYLLNAYMRILS